LTVKIDERSVERIGDEVVPEGRPVLLHRQDVRHLLNEVRREIVRDDEDDFLLTKYSLSMRSGDKRTKLKIAAAARIRSIRKQQKQQQIPLLDIP
jgi:hypothetical protein